MSVCIVTILINISDDDEESYARQGVRRLDLPNFAQGRAESVEKLVGRRLA
jgi:hypothetical protein